MRTECLQRNIEISNLGLFGTRDDNADYIGGEVHLDNEETMGWIEISHETLREYFEELN